MFTIEETDSENLAALEIQLTEERIEIFERLKSCQVSILDFDMNDYCSVELL